MSDEVINVRGAEKYLVKRTFLTQRGKGYQNFPHKCGFQTVIDLRQCCTFSGGERAFSLFLLQPFDQHLTPPTCDVTLCFTLNKTGSKEEGRKKKKSIRNSHKVIAANGLFFFLLFFKHLFIFERQSREGTEREGDRGS